MDKKIIVARIEEIMLEKGKSNYDLKENAEISTTIYQWRKNAKRDATRSPSLKSIEKICNYLGVPLAYFFSFKKEEQNNTRIDEITKNLTELNPEQLKVIEQVVEQFKLLQKDK